MSAAPGDAALGHLLLGDAAALRPVLANPSSRRAVARSLPHLLAAALGGAGGCLEATARFFAGTVLDDVTKSPPLGCLACLLSLPICDSRDCELFLIFNSGWLDGMYWMDGWMEEWWLFFFFVFHVARFFFFLQCRLFFLFFFDGFYRKHLSPLVSPSLSPCLYHHFLKNK
jgi:hypothetical protein